MQYGTSNDNHKNIKWMFILGLILFLISNHFVGLYINNFYETGDYLESLMYGANYLIPSFIPGSGYWMLISFELIALLLGLISFSSVFFIYAMNMDRRNNFRTKEEHGSSRYGDLINEAGQLGEEDKFDPFQIIYSEHVSVSMNTRKTFLNNNTLSVGGSGSGKTRFHVKPNILNMACNYIVTDPKDTLCKEVGNAFYQAGYDMKYLNLVDFSKSMHYNPLMYIYKPNDVLKFVNNLVSSTNKDVKASGDDGFFEKAEIALLTACIFFLFATSEDEPEKRNINNLMDMIDMADASEDDENATSPLDDMFNEFEQDMKQMVRTNQMTPMEYKNSYGFLAIRQYGLYRKAAGKTAKSILVSVGVRMGVFNLPEMYDLLRYDEMDLETIGNPKPQPKYDERHIQCTNDYGDPVFIDKNGNDCWVSHHDGDVVLNRVQEGFVDKYGVLHDESNVELGYVDCYGNVTEPKLQKTILFVAISDSDSTFNFLASIIYQQLFDLLYRQADSTIDGSLPIHTRFVLDEFANQSKIRDFEMKLATMRSRNISVDIILQNYAQIKAMYKDSWETIEGNCDVTLFLGGKEYSTLERLSKIIGNATVDYRNISESRSANGGSWSVSNQLIQRALMSPDEIGRLKSHECIVHVRGQQIFRDRKYDLMKHPNIIYTADYDKKNYFDTKKFEEFVTNKYYFPDETYEDIFGNDDDSMGDEDILDYLNDENTIDILESEIYA